MVLNAYRHHGGHHTHRHRGKGGRQLLVLNAYRHHGGHHHSRRRKHHGRGRCSTPIGITADITRGSWGRASRSNVLNAYRHIGITADITTRSRRRTARRSCAQRLSASRRTSPAVASTLAIRYSCAQRLSASRRTSLMTRGFNGAFKLCSTPIGITADITTPPGRGTSRAPPGAQRLSASRRTSRLLGGRAGERRRVLNAYRHHGGHHWLPHTLRVESAKCSTPIGITADITRRDTPPNQRIIVCSTPIGITADITSP